MYKMANKILLMLLFHALSDEDGCIFLFLTDQQNVFILENPVQMFLFEGAGRKLNTSVFLDHPFYEA